MKKKLLTTLSLILTLLFIVSCSSGGKPSVNDSAPSYMAYSGAASNPAMPQADYAGETETTASDGGSSFAGISTGTHINVSLAEKIIYSANASIETIHFEDSLAGLGDMITQFNAFIESSYESGADYASTYYGYNPYRNASYVIRVPRENFSVLLDSLSALGNVTSRSTNAVNVTEQYTDTESRLTVYKTEETRLLAMLEKCDTVADMLTIESALSSVRYEIESLTSRLKNLDNQVNYSSVTLSIREVEELTPAAQTHRSYGEQISDGFKDTLEHIGTFFKNLLKFILVNSPVIVIFVVILAVAIMLFRRFYKRSKKPSNSEKIPNDDADNK